MAGKITEFDINGHHYRANPLNARVALHVGKRLLQLAKALTPAAQEDTMAVITTAFKAGDRANPAVILQAMLPFVGSLGEALSQLNDTDLDFIMDRCLEVVERQNSTAGTWARIVARNGQIMFDDITLPSQLVIAGNVMKENLGDFFPELLRLLNVVAQEPQPVLN